MPKSEGAGEDWCPEEAPSSKSHGSEEAQSLADRGEVLGEQVPENPTLALLRLSDISQGYSPSPAARPAQARERWRGRPRSTTFQGTTQSRD